jgi:hypothetical protein
MLGIFDSIAGLILGSIVLIVLGGFILAIFFTSWPLVLFLLLGAICLSKGYIFLGILLIIIGFSANSCWASRL